MRNVPNDIVQGIIRHLPIIISHADSSSLDNRTKNAIRIMGKILRRLTAIENNASEAKQDRA